MINSSDKEILFSNIPIGNISLKSRVVVAPMTRISGTEDGLATKRMKKYYKRYAKGGFPLVITEGTYIDQEYSQGYPDQPGLATNEQVDSWKPITRALHDEGIPMFAQILHVGALAQHNPYKEQTIAPSAVKPKGEQLDFYGGEGEFDTPRAMNKDDINNVRNFFAEAAKNAKKAGFDGIEIHGANGYLIDQFITDYTNQRTDEYGGSLENRLRFGSEVIRAVRNAVGDDFPLGIRLSQTKVNDFEHRWESKEKAIQVFQTYAGQGLDYIHTTEADAAAEPFGDGKTFSQIAKEATDIPVMANGSLEDPKKAAAFIKQGKADLFSLAKGALANPNWPEKVGNGEEQNEFDAEAILMPEAYIKDSELEMR